MLKKATKLRKKTSPEEVTMPKGWIHEGKVIAIGHFDFAERVVTIAWESSNSGPTMGWVPPEKWEIIVEAFRGSGKIRIHSQYENPRDWMHDFSMLLAIK